MMYFCFIGLPGSGKSTQAKHLASSLEAECITTSEALKKIPEACDYIDRGENVPNEISCKVLQQTLEQKVSTHDQYVVLDGFPREQSNVVWLEKYTSGKVVYIVLDVCKETCMARVKGRCRDDVSTQSERHKIFEQNAALLLKDVPLDRIMTFNGEGGEEAIHHLIENNVYNRFIDVRRSEFIAVGQLRVGIQKGKSQQQAIEFFNRCHKEWQKLMDGSLDENGFEIVIVKPRDGAAMLQSGVIDIFVGTEDAPLYLKRGMGKHIKALYPPEIPHPEIKRADDLTPRLAFVANPKGTGKKLLSEYPGVDITDRYHEFDVVDLTGSAENFLQLKDSEFKEAFVVVETGASLREANLIETEHVRYIGINAFVQDIGLFKTLAARRNAFLVGPNTNPFLPDCMVIDPGAPNFDMANLKDTFSKLPLVIKGESKEVRYVGGGLVAIKFLPTLYSYSKNRAGVVEGTDELRLAMCKKMQEVFRLGGVPHAYIHIDHGFVLAHLVMPSPVEFYKYDQVIFSPSDLSKEQIDLIPKCPPVEVVVKKYQTGTLKHQAFALELCKVRDGHPLAGMTYEEENVLPEPFVRFDYRNPLKDKSGNRMADYTPGDDMMNLLIDTEKAKNLALQAQVAIDKFLNKSDIVNLDLCFNGITEDGTMMCAEISQDVGRFRHYRIGSLDKDIWRAGGTRCVEEILEKWKVMVDMITPVKADRIAAMMPSTPPIRIAFGSGNPGKIRELNALMLNIKKEFKSYRTDIPEPYDTLEKNAKAKMDGYMNSIDETDYDLLIVEDSGLFVDALGGSPGVFSARHSVVDEDTETRTRSQIDYDNNVKLLNEMKDATNRSAKFKICCRVYSKKEDKIWVFDDSVSGTISTDMRGKRGFGYDPVFIPNDSDGYTYAEMDGHRKNLRSHRHGIATKIAFLVEGIITKSNINP